MPGYAPSEAARRSGFSLDTLRYYERIGLLNEVGRTSGGRRVFTDDDLDWLMLFRCLRDTGMPIAEMCRYAELVREGEHTTGSARRCWSGTLGGSRSGCTCSNASTIACGRRSAPMTNAYVRVSHPTASTVQAHHAPRPAVRMREFG